MKNSVLLLFIIIIFVSCDHRKELADAYGNFEVEDVVVTAEAQGKLISFNLEEGEELVQAQFVGQIDTTTIVLQINQLDAQIQAVKSKTINVRAQIESQKQQKENLQVNQKRIKKLVNDGAATQMQLDDLDGGIKLIEKQISASKTQISSINKEVEVLNAQKDLLNNQLEKCKVIAPVGGTILEKYMQKGELVAMGKPLFKIADLSNLYLRCYISGDLLNQIKISDQVQIAIDGPEGESIALDGQVTWISNQAEFTPKIIQTKEERVKLVYAIKVKVQNDGQLKIGMPGEMRIIR